MLRDTANTEQIIPQQPNCSILNRSASGNTVRWSMLCQDGNTVMTGNGEMTLRGSSYDGVSQLTIKEGTDETQMTHRSTARRVGSC